MADIKPETRLFVADELREGHDLSLSAAQAHHLRDVLRLKDGAHIAFFNGSDGEWLASCRFTKKGCQAQVLRQRRKQADGADLWLLFAPIKHARLDFLVEKASELGVSVLQPVMTAYTQVSRLKTERLLANAREAAEQCERLTVPIVNEPLPLKEIGGGWDRDRPLYVCAESGAANSLQAAFSKQAGSKAALLIGPEGGFSPEEHDYLRALPFVVPVSLGPRLLRAETAALAVLSCWQALAGEWRSETARPYADIITA